MLRSDHSGAGRRKAALAFTTVLSYAVVACDQSSLTFVGNLPTGPVTQQLIVEPAEVTLSSNDSAEFRAIGLSASGDTTSVQLSWSATGGTVQGKGNGNAWGVYKGNQKGKQKVVATDTSGVADTAVVTVLEAPEADFTFSVTDLVVSFADASTDGDGTVTGWSWDFGDGASSTAKSPSHTYAAASSYSVTLTVTDNDGLTDSVTRSVAVTCEGDNCTQVGRIPLQFTSTVADFANPERGMLRNTRFFPDGSDFSTSHESAETMIWVYYMLENYRDRPIDALALARISETFDQARDAGLKILPLFTYNYGLNEPDAPLSQVLEHIGQLKPILQAQSDVISTFLLGFVGAWGEWHGSTNQLTEASSQKAILDATVDALPAYVPIQLRYPRDKKTHYGGPLTESEAFSGSAAARIGHHNLCFLAADDDEGTYRSTPRGSPSAATIEGWKDFIAEEGRFLPVGGETCRVNEPRSLCPVALAELEWMHWSWMNRTYYPDVLDSWVAGGCMDTIRRRLGYRLSFVDGSVVEAVRPGGLLELEVALRNEGYAAMYKRRPVFVVFEGDAVRYGAELPDVDPRRFEPGAPDTISVRVQLPADAPLGDYRVALWLPDEAASLRNRSEYAVRFANEGVWEAATGYNVLTSSVRVTDEAVGPTDPSAPRLVRW